MRALRGAPHESVRSMSAMRLSGVRRLLRHGTGPGAEKPGACGCARRRSGAWALLPGPQHEGRRVPARHRRTSVLWLRPGPHGDRRRGRRPHGAWRRSALGLQHRRRVSHRQADGAAGVLAGRQDDARRLRVAGLRRRPLAGAAAVERRRRVVLVPRARSTRLEIVRKPRSTVLDEVLVPLVDIFAT